MSKAAVRSPRTPRRATITATPAHAEVPRTLLEPPPRALGLVDMLGLWGNLGVSLLGFTGAIFVLQPGGAGTPTLSLLAAVTATVIGTLVGTLAVALAGMAGARTGAPSMVMLRGLFGRRLSLLPTLLNVLQCLGWGIFELVTIATATHVIAPALPYSAVVLIAGALTTALALRPLGTVRLLRRYVLVAVVLVLGYLAIQLLRHPLPSFTSGTWDGYWVAMDTTVAVAVSFMPLAADYTRHARTPRTAFTGTLAGYAVAQIACYLIGLLALVTVAATPDDIYGAFVAVPLGALGFAILAARELDQSFANVYSTAVSLQNLRRSWDRRILAAAIGGITTLLALVFTISDYEGFLLLLGSVFVPLFGVLVVDLFSRRDWNTSDSAPSRWVMLVPWALGIATYQLINPGTVAGWSDAWTRIAAAIHFTPQPWMSASICSFAVAAVTGALAGRLRR